MVFATSTPASLNAAILDAAISDDLRTERNPAIWRGSLHGKLPSVESVKKAKAPTDKDLWMTKNWGKETLDV